MFAASDCAALFDLTAELPAPAVVKHYDALPSLDLTPLPAQTLLEAAQRSERLREHGAGLVACALGYSRSAATVAVWLRWSGRADSMEAALTLLRARRPQVVLGTVWRQRLEEVEGLLQGASHGN
jgi:protein-tyrosine phosphatase